MIDLKIKIIFYLRRDNIIENSTETRLLKYLIYI